MSTNATDRGRTERERPCPRRLDGRLVPFVWAHRGASALAAENTLESFALAAELDADGIELDLQLTSDAVPVIVHDPFLWTDGEELFLRPPSAGVARTMRPLAIAEMTWAEIDGVLVEHPGGSRERVPRLEEVLEAVPETLWLDVELKAGWTYDRRLVGVFCDRMRDRERVLASSFDHVILKELGESDPSVPRLAILHARPVDLIGMLSAIPASMTSIDRAFLTAEDVSRWKEEGIDVSIGGRELLDDLDEVLSWPVTGVFLDDPRLARS